MTKTTQGMLTVMALLTAACGSELRLSPTLVVQLQVSPPTASLAAGQQQQLTATAVYQDGHTRDLSAEVSWAVVDGSVATVDAGGLVHGAAAGTTRVTASLQGQTAEAGLTVTAATLASLEVVPGLLRVPLGAAVTAVATGRFTDDTVVDLTGQVAWSTPLGGLVVESAGLARASAKGPARLSARFNGMQASADLEVTDAAPLSLRLATARDLAALPRGARAGVTARATFTDGSDVDVSADATWSSDAEEVARVEGGAVRGLELGSARLEASYQGQRAGLDVTVTPAELVGLALSPPQATAPLGAFASLTALGTYSDGSVGDVTDQVTWLSLSPLAVQVSNLADDAGHAWGLVRGQQSVVTAQLPGTGLMASALVQVGAPAVKSWRLDYGKKPQVPVLSVGDQLQVSATVTYTDGTTGDASNLVSWVSYSPGVVTLDPHHPGLVQAVAPGRATVVVTREDPRVWLSLEVIVR